MQRQKYRGMLETQKSRNKTSSGDIGLDIRTLASPKVGQDQVSGGVSVLSYFSVLIHCQFVINTTALANEPSIRYYFQLLNSKELKNLRYFKFDCNSTVTFDSNSIRKCELSNIRQLHFEV